MSGTLPVVITVDGLQPQNPVDLRNQLDTLVTAAAPGYTSRLPASIIEDLASTVVYAISLCDQARVEYVNSLTPYGANAFLLAQLGSMLGIPQGQATNTSAFVVFSGPIGNPTSAAGEAIQPGTIVGDGVHQYTVTDGGTIASNGSSLPLAVVATTSGSWAVPANTINQIFTSFGDLELVVTNPEAGTASQGAQTVSSYRAQVLQQERAAAQGMPTYLRSKLQAIPGVQMNLISIRNITGGGWEIICGGGDNYLVAGAIYAAVPDVSTLQGSTLQVSGATQANPCVITTNLNHGYTTGESVTIAGALGMTGINGTWTVTILTPTTFSIPFNASAAPAYTGGGVCTPNPRNITTTIQDGPDTYNIYYVNPPQQTVNITLLWNTTAVNFVSDDAVNSLGSQAIVSYVNAIFAGQPINIFALEAIFQTAIASILPTDLLDRMVWAFSINGVGTPPSTGTGLIIGDPESYFFASSTTVSVTRG